MRSLVREGLNLNEWMDPLSGLQDPWRGLSRPWRGSKGAPGAGNKFVLEDRRLRRGLGSKALKN